ncbi:MAG: twin-arginine translocase TatA/TatE family subunit [Myxococcales bacterium]|nr:twin-arginine translocase TatA/TatE family subunit [Myxococcales bacterium]
MLGMPELLVILAIVVILFGATKLPQLGKGIGEALGNFKKAQRETERDSLRHEVDATPRVDTQPRETRLEKDASKG